MDRLIKRLDSDICEQYAEMLLYSGWLNLPYVEDDLIEYMEFWTKDNTLTVILVTDNIEWHVLTIIVDVDEPSMWMLQLFGA